MALSPDRYTTHVVTRIEEYVNDSVPWQRSLWQLGTVLVLKEVAEYADQLRRGAIRDEGVRYVCQAAREQCAKDPAVRDTAVGNRLDVLLGNPKDFKSEYISAELEHLAGRVDQGYFGRLAAVHRTSARQPSAERASRFIAAHLLDTELSGDAIKIWIHEMEDESSTCSVADLCDSAAELVGRPPRKFSVIVPFRRFPDLGIRRHSDSADRSLSVLGTDAVREKLGSSSNEFDSLAGGVQVQVTARDPAAAVTHTQELLSRLLARLSVSPAHAAAADLHDRAVVIGSRVTYLLSQQRRANSGGRSICLYEFGEYLGGLLPIVDLTGPVVDFGSHHR